MSIHTGKSSKSAKLYIIAAVLMFIQTSVIFVVIEILPGMGFGDIWAVLETLESFIWVFPLIGVLFIVGSFFARTGLGVTGTTKRDVGGGYYQSTVETANGITCGCMTGIAVLGISITFSIPHIESTSGLVLVAAIPAILAGLIAMLAGFTSLSATMKRGTVQMGQDTSPVPVDSRTCPYCSKTGLSPQATSCPSCGQPIA
ncbi:MAG: hypothetical protein ACTSU3_03585 [Candidatus Thorarchaeota archaeon]